jgi:hypothetical protein
LIGPVATVAPPDLGVNTRLRVVLDVHVSLADPGPAAVVNVWVLDWPPVTVPLKVTLVTVADAGEITAPTAPSATTTMTLRGMTRRETVSRRDAVRFRAVLTMCGLLMNPERVSVRSWSAVVAET